MTATLPLAIFFETAEPSLRLSWAASEIFGLKPFFSQEGFPQSLLIRSFAKLFRQCAGPFRRQRCQALGLEEADYASGPSVALQRNRL